MLNYIWPWKIDCVDMCDLLITFHQENFHSMNSFVLKIYFEEKVGFLVTLRGGGGSLSNIMMM